MTTKNNAEKSLLVIPKGFLSNTIFYHKHYTEPSHHIRLGLST